MEKENPMSFNESTPLPDCRIKLGDTAERHGVIELVTGPDHPDAVRNHFLMNLYRLFSAGKCWTIPRQEPFESQRTETGLILDWKPTATLPVAMRATYEIQNDGADLDLTIQVKAEQNLPAFELLTSSYFHLDYEPHCVLALPDHEHSIKPQLWKVEDHPYLHGLYTHIKRDEKAIATRLDGRWNKPDGSSIAPASHGADYAWPVTVMSNPHLKNASGKNGIFIVQSAERAACDSVLMTYRGDPQHDHIANHNATYLSLFCRDLTKGEAAEVKVHQSVRCGMPTTETIRAAIPASFRVD
jgi:hypothetical protein